MPTKTEAKLKLEICLEQDQDTPAPFEDDVFSLCSLFTDGRDAIQRKLEEFAEAGRVEGRHWWWVSCYRHGGEYWFLEGEASRGADPWDTTGKAGILYLDTGNPEDVGPTPREAARNILEEYNRWCSGDCWYLKIEREVEDTIAGTCPCCQTPDVHWFERHNETLEDGGGYIGLEVALTELGDRLKRILQDNPYFINWYEVQITGDTCSGDVADKVRELGFTVEGDQG